MYFANSTEMIRLLLAHGANPNIRTATTGQTVFEKFLGEDYSKNQGNFT